MAMVDRTVHQYWVLGVLRRHAAVDEATSWEAFLASPFGAHIPVVSWPTVAWTADRVRRVMGGMWEGAAPGTLGIPLAVWKSLPECWAAAVARPLTLVEADGYWTDEWLQAYVAMIPKASGGS
jgi:hypothetical protein